MKTPLSILLLLSAIIAVAQPPVAPLQDQLLEDVVEATEREFDFDTYADYLEQLLEQPLNLNIATEAELTELRLLTDQQISALLLYRKRHGDLLAVYELQAIPFFDLETIAKLLPYVAVSAERRSIPLGKAITYGRSQLFLRYQQVLEPQAGYLVPDTVTDRQRYLGSPERLYLRYQFRYSRKFSVGLTAEKDPGEPLFDSLQTTPDFLSAHAYLQDVGRFKSIAVGDFAVNAGQGLVLWSGFGFNKSPYPLQVRRSGFTVRPYTSVNEALFFRGAAASYQLTDRWQATAFVSRKQLDASIGEVDTTDGLVADISSISVSGLHRTAGERAGKDAVTELVAGTVIQRSGRWLDIGAAVVHTNLSASLIPRPQLYNQYRFRGQSLTNAGINYTANVRNALLFGEVAHSIGSGWATLHGLSMKLDEKTAFSLVFRHYDRDYQSLYTNAFGESSTVENETGIYLGMSTQLSRKLTWSGFADFYRHPWLRFLTDAPSHGAEYLGQLTYTMGRGRELQVRVRHETKWRNVPDNDTPIDYLAPTARTEYRIHLSQAVNSRITLRSRAVYTRFRVQPDAATEEGFLLFQDVQYRFRRRPLSVAARYALFSTESFNTRIYAYESDALYNFSVPTYNGEGQRWYVLLSYELGEHLQAWVRLAQFHYPFMNSIGSGLDAIDGNSRTELKIQLRFRW